MDTDTTNPVDVEDTADATLDTAQEVESDSQGELETLYDDDGNPIEGPPEEEEIELDEELKFKVPKDHAQKVREALLRQADYTRKTQALAEANKAFAAQLAQFHQSTEAELAAYARASNLADQIAQYERIDWAAWHDQDPFAASRATSEFQTAQRAYQQAMGQLSQFRQQRLSMEQQETAKRMEEGRAALTRDIPAWNEAHKAKLIDFAAGFGFSRDELADLEADPRVAKVLHAAFEGAETSRKVQKAQSHIAAQQVQPAGKVKATTAPPAGLDDRLSLDEWNRRREAQIRKKAGR